MASFRVKQSGPKYAHMSTLRWWREGYSWRTDKTCRTRGESNHHRRLEHKSRLSKNGKLIGELEYDLEEQNVGWNSSIKVCSKHNLVVSNRLFNNYKQRIYTRKGPASNGRYQIDYITVCQKCWNHKA